MNDDGSPPTEDLTEEEFEEQRDLIASVEELRALLAPLSDDDRRQVLGLARSLSHVSDPEARF